MFTGLIKDLGVIKRLTPNAEGVEIQIQNETRSRYSY